MAQRTQKDLLTRLADAGEEAIQRLASTPGADRLMGVMTNMREQMDALTSRVRGMEGLERRVEKLEREVAKLSKSASKSSTPARKPAARKTSSTRKTSASSRSTPKKR